jgi:hypothetical protein
MDYRPPAFIIVRVPELTFNLADFQRAYPLNLTPEDTKIEFIHGGSSIVRNFSLDDLDEAFRSASPPAELTIPQ